MDKHNEKTRETIGAPDNFEQFWLEHSAQLLHNDEEYSKATGKYKMTTGADWLLFAIPVAVGVFLKDYLPIANELLNLLACVAAAFLSFLLCVWVKTVISGVPDLSAIEKRVKDEAREKWMAQRAASEEDKTVAPRRR